MVVSSSSSSPKNEGELPCFNSSSAACSAVSSVTLDSKPMSPEYSPTLHSRSMAARVMSSGMGSCDNTLKVMIVL